MRCKLGATPECKVNFWRAELEALRQIVLECGLTEEVKWGVPCYTSEDKNILMVSAFKDYACISFFKGVLLKDEANILLKPGESSQSTRTLKYTTLEQVLGQAPIIKAYIAVTIGGWGSLTGAACGALIIALFEVLLPSLPVLVPALKNVTPWLFTQTSSTILLYICLLAIMFFRPQGLFGEKVQKRV